MRLCTDATSIAMIEINHGNLLDDPCLDSILIKVVAQLEQRQHKQSSEQNK